MRETIQFLAFGLFFGYVLSRSGAADYDYIQGMFLFTNPQLYLILGGAVVTTAIGLQLLRRVGRTATGEEIVIKPKAVHRGNLVGGALFGVGWALTGMCPGPIIVNVGEGKVYALAAFAGVMTGTWLVGRFYEPISARMGMPALTTPAAVEAGGEGAGA